jgi:hypothetical protein
VAVPLQSCLRPLLHNRLIAGQPPSAAPTMPHTPWVPVVLAPWLNTASLALPALPAPTLNPLSPRPPGSSSVPRPAASPESSSTLLLTPRPTAAPTAVARCTIQTARTGSSVITNLPTSGAALTTTVEHWHLYQRNLSTNALSVEML